MIHWIFQAWKKKLPARNSTISFFLFQTSAGPEFIAEKHFSSSCEETENDSVRDGEDEETTDDVDDDESKDTKDEKDETTKQTAGGKTKKLMNQFNFCERASITYQYLLKVHTFTNFLMPFVTCAVKLEYIKYCGYPFKFKKKY